MSVALLVLLAGSPELPIDDTADPIVVTGSRLAEAAEPSIARGNLERMQPVSLEAALNDVAGVRAVTTGGDAGGSFVSVRGGEPNFTLVLVEGLRLNNPTNSRGGAFDFLSIDPQAIDRVEVFRSAASAVHGSDALAGVINLRLRTPRSEGVALAARGLVDSEGALGGGASLDLGWASGGVFADASHFSDRELEDGSTLERSQVLLHATQRLSDWALQGVALYGHSRFERFPENSGGPRLAVLRDLEVGTQELAAFGVNLRREPGSVVRPHLALSYSHQRDILDTPAIAPGVLDGTPALTGDTRFRRFEATADVGLRLGALDAVVGGAIRDERGRSTGALMIGFPLPVSFEQQRTTRSIFAEARIEPLPGLTIDGGVRHDAVNHGSGRTTGSGGVAFRVSARGPTLFARIGQGYKLPSFYALSHPLVGNAALHPERSTSVEAGIEQRFDRSSMRVAVFDNRYRDLVDFDAATFRLVNRDHVRARGVEMEGRVGIGTVTFSGALTYVDLDSPEPLRGRPNWQGNVHALWQANSRVQIDAAFRANSSLIDTAVPTGTQTIAGHAEFDLGIAVRVLPGIVASLTGRNLAGARYEDAVGFPAKRQLIRFALRAALD